ncbi:MAG: carbamate kinase [Lachnospiraceae bacterium]|nr:carbamate kinase [Lachnospiraceae bacterium]
MRRKRIVIALGGNALGNNVAEQREAVARTARVIVDLAEEDMDIVLTHGNGPQVGMIQSAMDRMSHEGEGGPVPLPTSVAMSQGYIGFDLQNAVKYELYRRGLDRKVSTILSQVEVDADDPEFLNPTKPIGRFMTKDEAEKKEAAGAFCMEDAGRGYRIVVASPKPRRIRELETIRTLVEAGHIVVACGGGGIPVVWKEGRLVGVDAVIDKDRVSSLLAVCLDADYLVILTAVEKVAIHFGTEKQEWLSELSVSQARQYIAQNEFAKGSMLPKIEAALHFAESGEDRQALITLLDKAAEGIAGKTGTRIRR